MLEPASHWEAREMPAELDYPNMRRNGMTRGLDGMQRVDGRGPVTAFESNDDPEALLFCWQSYRHFIPKEFVDLVWPSELIGNPHTVTYGPRELTHSDVFNCWNAWRLYDFNVPHKRVVEIGGGFGSLAGMLLKMWPDIEEYHCVDLPESLDLQNYYLGEMFPNRKGLCYWCGTGDINEADLVINLRSMMEMPLDTVNAYLVDIERLRPWFYCVNRYRKYHPIQRWQFSDNWRIHISQTEMLYANQHEFLLEWEEGNQFTKALRTLYPPKV